MESAGILSFSTRAVNSEIVGVWYDPTKQNGQADCGRESGSCPNAIRATPGRGRSVSLHSFNTQSVARIVEEELIAVGIVDYQESVAPPTILNRNAFGREFCA